MNDFVVIENPQRPPGVYKHVTPINAFFNIRSANIADEIVRFADVTVDIGRRKIMRGGEIVRLTRAEYNLLLVFVHNLDRALTRDPSLNAAWRSEFCPNSTPVMYNAC